MKVLETGDEIRVIAPSTSWNNRRNNRGYERAEERLESLGYRISFSNSIENVFHFDTARREDRAADFNDAYRDKNVKLVMALGGGWSANEILPLINWEVVSDNPKPLIGYSDITVLLNAVYAKTGNTGYLGPNFSTFGKMTEWQYTLSSFKLAMDNSKGKLVRSQTWSDRGRKRHKTKAWKGFQRGEAEARVLGGNLGTFYLLQGTEFLPSFNEPFIFLLEDDCESGKRTPEAVSRRFESLLQLPGFRTNLKGLVIGRFQPGSKLSSRNLESIIMSKDLGDIPICYNIDFGHTLPLLTLPIGGQMKLKISNAVEISLL